MCTYMKEVVILIFPRAIRHWLRWRGTNWLHLKCKWKSINGTNDVKSAIWNEFSPSYLVSSLWEPCAHRRHINDDKVAVTGRGQHQN